MKKLILSVFTVAIAHFAFAQQGSVTAKSGNVVVAEANVEVQEALQTMSRGQYPSFTAYLPSAEGKMAVDVWKETMKGYKGKTKKKGSELVTVTEKMPALGTGEVTLYAQFNEQELTVWVENSNGFVSSGTLEGSFAFIEELFNDYRFDLRKAMAAQNVEEQEKALKEMEKDLEKLEKENKSLHETIEKAKAAIADAEQGIDANIKAQGAKQEEIETQTEAVKEAQELHKSIARFKKGR